jgi:hypothetical protein
MTSFAEALVAIQNHTQPIDVLSKTLRPELVEEALRMTGTASIRRRKIPAEQVVWLMVGMSLYANQSIKKSFDLLDIQVNGKVVSSSVSDARKRLGPAPMQYLFRKLGEHWTAPQPEFLYHGLSLFGIDGTVFNVADSDANTEYFGRPVSRTGESAYPQARVVTLMELNARVLRSATITSLAKSERASADLLYRDLPQSSICLMDRGFSSYRQFSAIVKDQENRHFLCRVRSDNAPKLVERLTDGSWMVRIKPSQKADKEDSSLPQEMLIRRVEYQVEGHPDKIFLYTSLMDADLFPAIELAELYHKRWELELAFDEIKTKMLLRKEALRSNLPAGVEQEIWATLLTYNLVRHQMAHVAKEHDIAPSRLSFKYSLLAVANLFMAESRDPTVGRLPEIVEALRVEIWDARNPARRGERSNRRCVKIKMSGYPRKADRRRTIQSQA